ncbi:MAG: hypothetical protein RL264_164 [Bacteroidota bacterium]|jgi:hypothetical protein
MNERIFIEGVAKGFYKKTSSYSTGNFEIADIELESIDVWNSKTISDTILIEHEVGSYFKPTYFHDIRIFVSESDYLKLRTKDFIIRDLEIGEILNTKDGQLTAYTGKIIAQIDKPLPPPDVEVNRTRFSNQDTTKTSSSKRFADSRYSHLFSSSLGTVVDNVIPKSNSSKLKSETNIQPETSFFSGCLGILILVGLLIGVSAFYSFWYFGVFLSIYLIIVYLINQLGWKNTWLFKTFSVVRFDYHYLGIIVLLLALAYYCHNGYHEFLPYIFAIGGALILLSFLAPILRLLSFIFTIATVFSIVSFFVDYFKYESDDSKTDDDIEYVDEDDEDWFPKVDTLNTSDTSNQDYFSNVLTWKDYDKNAYTGTFKIRKDNFSAAKLHRENLEIQAKNSRNYWNQIYGQISKRNEKYIDEIVNEYAKIIKEKKLNKSDAAKMVVTSIQSIDYCLVHDYTHSEAEKMFGGFISEYHRTGKPCLSKIKFGVQSPSEFMSNLKGDCDTRSVMLHVVLTRLGFNTTVLASDRYSHAILGISGNYTGKNVKWNGIKYYVWETTAEGFQPGVLSSQVGNIDYWYVAL